MFLKVVLALLTILIGYRTARLVLNYNSARRIGLPVIILPCNWQDGLWIVVAPLFRFLNHVPGFSWYKYSYMGCHLHVRHEPFARFGTKAVTLVTPGWNEIVTCDGPAVAEIGGRYKKWDKPEVLYDLFAMFGPNSLSKNGDEWLRHRRIVNQGLARNDLARAGASKQANEWLNLIPDGKPRTLKELTDDMDVISSNVLNYAGFGQDNPFDKNDTSLMRIPEGHTQSFADAMHFMSVEFIFAWVFSKISVPKWCEFEKLRKLRATSAELRQYFSEIIQRRDGEVVRALVEANEKEKAIGGGGSLTTEEMYGNMYLLQLAGYETTSSVMLFSLAMLASYPEVQEWARGSYERCNAVMHETLRLFGALPVMTRSSSRDETILIAGKEVFVPANTYVSGSMPAYHHDPAVWGPDVTVWKPQRWIETVGGQDKIKRQPELLAWSSGSRACPGMKFSQVEFCEVIKTALDRCELKGSDGILEIANEFDVSVSNKVRKPTKASITFVKRGMQ